MSFALGSDELLDEPASDPTGTVYGVQARARNGSPKGPRDPVSRCFARSRLLARSQRRANLLVSVGRSDEVFDDFRDEMSRLSSLDAATMQYKLASAYADMGMIDESIDALEVSVRALRYRFDAAAQLGRLYRKLGMLNHAVEWLQQAVAAPAPTVEAGRAITYELAETYENLGQRQRALAVFSMLLTTDGGYRDVRQRVARLSGT